MTPEELANLARLRRARDLMDREYASPLDVAALARTALMSPAHFSRKFRATYGETPTAYRARDHRALAGLPGCVTREITRPSRVRGRADDAPGALAR